MNVRNLLLASAIGLSLLGGARSVAAAEEAKIPTIPPTNPNEHPLKPALVWAEQIQDYLDATVKDYTCKFIKRERHNGQIVEQTALAKFRNAPFSTYMEFVEPKKVVGREAIYVHGENDNRLLGRGNGLQRLAGWLPLVPTGLIPMKDNHYPITEAGIRNLTKRLIEVAKEDMKWDQCQVQFYYKIKLNDSLTTVVEVIHPQPARQFKFHKARIYVDDELHLPIRYEAHDWPSKPDEKPPLMEEYTYLKLKTNVGLTDKDFDPNNYK